MLRSHSCRSRQLYLEVLERRELPATYTVVNTADAGAGSLRQSILNANTNTGLDIIDFSIGSGVQTITPLSALPTITDPVNILGYTQPGFLGAPIIEINGSNAGTSVSGLVIAAGSSQIWDLVINRFDGAGIDLSGAGNNLLIGNFLGTDVAGTVALGNVHGVRLTSSNNNAIGIPGGANLISGNTNYGVYLLSNCSNNTLQGNYIGTNAAGTAAVGNSFGIVLFGFASNNNTIGGTFSGSGNLISGNFGSGLNLEGTGNTVLGNRIGTNAAGTAAVPNGQGVSTSPFATNTVIGGTVSGARNIISGNSAEGIFLHGSNEIVEGNYIGTDATGTVAIANSTGIEVLFAAGAIIGGTTAGSRNIISGNSQVGIIVFSAQASVQGNYIGTDVTGTAAIGNKYGLLTYSSSNTTIGGTAIGAGNLISGNSFAGVHLDGSFETIQGNLIGTDVSGTTALANGVIGIEVVSATGSIIGGTIPSARNVISGNGTYNVLGYGPNFTVQGNYIGTDIAGSTAVAPTTVGVGVQLSGSGITIGGTAAGAGNLISGNLTGIELFQASGIFVEGNYIGTNPAGTAAVANGTGVRILGGASTNTIGGTSAGARNLISGNSFDGVVISGSSTTANPVEGNYIGTDLTGTLALGNGRDGVLIYQGANGNTIGGKFSTASNIISGNGRAGVHINGSGSSNNAVIRNRIGTDANGTAKIGNTFGVLIDQAATGNIVGGTSVSDRNIISGNNRNGVAIAGNGTNGNRVEGNYIGTDWTGNLPLSNPVGVSIFRLAKNNIIGGTSLTKTNVISGNGSVGISIRSNAAGNLVQWNYIGTDPTGNVPVPNGVGVSVTDSASGSLIEGNGIEFNMTVGVLVDNAAGHRILTNVIRDNGGLGIKLLNNGNNLQPFPVLTSVVNGGGSITILGTITAAPNTAYALEFFSNPVCDGSGFGEGRYFLGTQSYTTNGSGTVTFSAGFTANVPSGYQITSTATSPTGDTSEFSACFLAPLPPPEPDAPAAWLVMNERPATKAIPVSDPLTQQYQAQPPVDELPEFSTTSRPRQSTPSRFVFIEPTISDASDYLELSIVYEGTNLTKTIWCSETRNRLGETVPLLVAKLVVPCRPE